jgi:insulysin
MATINGCWGKPLVRLVTDAVEKPDADDRLYRVIRLANDLEAVLVHDAKADKASGALSVGVGSYSDDTDMPGLAHAVEHMLFMGTEKVSR